MKEACRLPRKWLILPLCLLLALLTLTQCTLAREHRERAVLLYVYSASVEFSVPTSMILAVIRTESDFRPDALSAAGARGLMQLLPETFLWLREEKLCEALADDAITDPEVNIRYGTYYLAYLYARFGSWHTALAAYNAGEGRVSQWLESPDISRDGVLVSIPFPETAFYVKKVLAVKTIYEKLYP